MPKTISVAVPEACTLCPRQCKADRAAGHRQEPFQDGTDPDNRCHTDARSRHFGKRH